VAAVFFRYIKFLQKAGFSKGISSELQHMSMIKFEYREKPTETELVRHISSELEKDSCKIDRLLSSDRVRTLDHKAIGDALDRIRPDNCMLYTVSPTLPADSEVQTEIWYGTKFTKEILQIPETMLEPCPDDGFQLPGRNKYMPRKLVVGKRGGKPEAPRVLLNDDKICLYYNEDKAFGHPITHLWLQMEFPKFYATITSRSMAGIIEGLIKHQLRELLGLGEPCGINGNVMVNTKGLEVYVSGFNNGTNFCLFVVDLLQKIRSLQFTEAIFDRLKHDYEVFCGAYSKKPPYTRITERMACLTREGMFARDDIRKTLPGITMDAAENFYRNLFSRLHFVAYSGGNMTQREASDLAESIKKVFSTSSLRRSEYPTLRSLEVPFGSRCRYIYQGGETSVDDCVQYCMYFGNVHDRDLRVKVRLLQQIFSGPAFEQLRHNEGLGYVVYTNVETWGTAMSFLVTVQGTKPALYLESRIQKFLYDTVDSFTRMDDETFATHLGALVGDLRRPRHSLYMQSSKDWERIYAGDLDFKRGKSPILASNMLFLICL
jgi:insulysin